MFERRQHPLKRFSLRLCRLLFLLSLLWMLGSWVEQGSFNLDERMYHALTSSSRGEKPLRLGDVDAKLNIIPQPKESVRTQYPEVGALLLDVDALNESFMARDEYAPQDLAVILNELAKVDLLSLGFSSTLDWKLNKKDMGLQALEMSLAALPHITIGLRAQLAAQADFTPENIRHIAIPLEQIEGDISGLPSANKCMPSILTSSAKLNWAPDWVMDEPLILMPGQHQGFPLLLRWNGEIYPTLPLCMAMETLNLRPENIRVKLGSWIKLGSRQLPLDDHGRVSVMKSKLRSLQLASVLDDPTSIPAHVIVEHSPQQPSLGSRRLNCMARSLSSLLSVGARHIDVSMKMEQVLLLREARWQDSARWAYLLPCLLGLTLLILPSCPKSARIVIYILLLASIIYVTMRLLSDGRWIPINSYLACWVAISLVGARIMGVNNKRLR